MKLRAIVVDDEPHARESLCRLLKAHPEIDVVAECQNGLEAVKAVHNLQPEVMFLDIHMPKLDGFDVLELLGASMPMTVFVSAHDEYALQAFEASALDYLLKPVSADRLAKSTERLASRWRESSHAFALPDTDAMLRKHQQGAAPINRILVRDKADVHVVPTADIIAIEAADDYVVIHTEKMKHIKQDTLANLEALLDNKQFCRIHRSTIINLDYLVGIETEGRDSRFALMKNNSQYAVSRSGYAKLVQQL